MAVTFYRYDDASAPALTGTADSIIAVLDAILVNGYGAKAAAGWTKAYTGTNKAAYRMASGAGKAGYYLRVLDSGDTNRSFRWRTYKTMSDVDTGTNPVPTVAQMAADGFYFAKSNTSDSTARPWWCVADDQGVFFYSWYNSTAFDASTNSQQGNFLYMAQCDQYDGTVDTNLVAVFGRSNTTLTSAAGGGPGVHSGVSSYFANVNDFYLSKSYFGPEGSVNSSIRTRGWSHSASSISGSQATGITSPDPVTGDLDLEHHYAFQNHGTGYIGVPVCKLPYFLHIGNLTTANMNQQTYTGNGNWAGSTFMFQTVFWSSGNIYGVIAVKTSGAR